jgi:hypothetical protein
MTAARCSRARSACKPRDLSAYRKACSSKIVPYRRFETMDDSTMPMLRNCLPLAILGFLAACQSNAPGPAVSSGKSAALRTMEQIAIAAHACWFASKDPAFKPYRMANELNSFSGRPRFLLVPAKHYEGKPLLVVQAEGAAPDVQAFGPLLDEALGERITVDIRRWQSGSSSCQAAA